MITPRITPLRLPLAKITIDPNCQSRVAIDAGTVTDYAEVMIRAGNDDVFPPIVVFHNGKGNWLADGFHRYEAAKKAGLESIKADIRSGDRRDAILHSAGANATHGLRRANADKRRAVSMLLEDKEWSRWSNRAIADRCGVDEGLVRKMRFPSADEPQIARKVERKGTVFEMDTSGIGKKANRDEPRTDEVREDQKQEPTSEPRDNPEGQLGDLKVAWESTSKDVRDHFVDRVVFADPDDYNPLMREWKYLSQSARVYAFLYVKNGWGDDRNRNDHPIIREAMRSFLDAAWEATEDQRREFMEIYLRRVPPGTILNASAGRQRHA